MYRELASEKRLSFSDEERRRLAAKALTDVFLAATYDARDDPECVVQVAVHLLPRVVRRLNVTARDNGDLAKCT